jgi:phosphoserine phosphatase RsbU/P
VLRNQLSAALDQLDRELQTVGQIQRSLLPQELPQIPGLQIAAQYVTSARAGGDYYDFFPLSGGQWGIVIADVSGHGTPAAVLMAVTHAIAHARPDTQAPPEAMLRHLNEHLTAAYTRDGTFVTAFYGVYDPATRHLAYARAGHNPPRLVRGSDVISLDDAGTLPLGIVPDQTYPQAGVQLQPGDLLVLYTDGITEAMPPAHANRPREMFGVDRLDALLLGCTSHDANQCLEAICNAVVEHSQGAPVKDDQTLVAIRCTG